MGNQIVIPNVGYAGCSFTSKLIGTLMGTFIVYLPAIVLVLLGILIVKNAERRKQKIYLFLAGFLLISALGYRVYLSTKGLPLTFPFACI